MPKTEAEKAAQRRYVEKNPEKIQEIHRRYEEKRPPRNRAEYMREYRRRKKLEQSEDESV